MTTNRVSLKSNINKLIKFFAVAMGWIALSGQAQSQAIELLASKLQPPAWQRVALQHNAQPFEFAAYANHDLSETDFNIKEKVV